MDKIKKYKIAIYSIGWSIFFTSILIVCAYWVYKIVDIQQTKLAIANNTHFSQICGNAIVDPITCLFDFILPFTFGSILILYTNAFINKEKIFSITIALVLSIIITFGLVRELAEIGYLFGDDLPLFSRIWWWPFGEL